MAEIESSEAPNGQEREKDEREEKEVGEEDEDEEENNSMSELQSSIPSITVPDRSSFEAEFRYQSSQSETLAVPPQIPLSENDHDSDCPSFSQLLAGAMASPVANSTGVFVDGLSVKPMLPTASVDPMGFPIVSPSSLLDPAGFKGQFGMSHQEVLASVTAQAAQAQAHKQHQDGYPSSSSELSHVSVIQPMTSPPSSIPVQQKSSQVDEDNDVCMMEADEQSFSDQKIKPAQVVVKTPSTDGYNWRKYGQKQVKSTESSRSYYKCTYSDCHAKKKVERCDHSGRVIDTIYKGRHSHDPPRKIKSTRARRLVPSAVPVVKTDTIDCTVKKLDDSDPSTSKRETDQLVLQTPEQKLQGSSGSEMNAILKSEEHGEEPEAKRRIKESNIACSAPHFKTIKEPKIVVHATDDVGISGDGYRWRKYGQKMVKGNPHPRSYYKCTSAGCPVRKHVERATDDTTAIIITYEGKHDHDMPVPKKRHGPPSAALLIAAAAAMNNAQFKKTDTSPNRRSSNQWSMDVESESVGEKALELGGEKALESARTLLSIGIELKPW